MIFENDEQLMESCLKWQKILRLQDWTVKAKVARGGEFTLSNSQGECHWVLESKLASIHILDPVDYPPSSMIPQDMEKTLVHELLHLHYAPFDNFDRDSLENTAMEQSIDLTARALVELERGVH